MPTEVTGFRSLKSPCEHALGINLIIPLLPTVAFAHLVAASSRPTTATTPPVHRHLRPSRSATALPVCRCHSDGRLPSPDDRRYRLHPPYPNNQSPPGCSWPPRRRRRPGTDLRAVEAAREPLPSGPRARSGISHPSRFSFLEVRILICFYFPGKSKIDPVALSLARPRWPKCRRSALYPLIACISAAAAPLSSST
ncbi:hypothetical protein GUJ93_ZPchr0010g11068 [Zizania palustris]|uniref:Uncharacterized protein n=1 Tax=Zizania palustris TaxID=103762 RepID=A0A8J5WD77_ZIZPA|nr:hypothetical protein GUJ93_ZPchr0010g11068 [Zizania palustris]